ncbi:hypothetical protein GCM10010112_69490 [Actinoplanes lobatus]|uniref:Sulfatase-modifying factor enzyme domain-containing protein n=1 Tax=Actinoplanes lobatus TaxID=113568 RepID=A0A7W7HM84_9ACTN|nr:hypothetical protein [Actinoplanes lobatus]MBB4753074.1 hypothetical protein [Actinoplanes lobatus]GGN87155.1 hypothetical protein GCM10010112_69490 [Actinoplanes lobatus]GIE39681.1 hypothetical protein Alo02nite_25790 [Actinoplanes lobatus]
MSHVDLTVDGWLALSDAGAAGVAAAIAHDVGAALVSVSTHSYAGRSGRVALFERDGIRYALVPGGTVELGCDPARFVPTSRQLHDFAEAVAAYSVPEPIHRFLAEQMSPTRRATLPARLVAVRSVDADSLLTAEHDGTDDHESVMARLEWRGLRPPTPDEWEYDCGAGATTLFRWGDEYPDGEPYGDVPLIQSPNFFGLVIGDDPYRAEFTTDPAVLCGGDGGSALCGGYGGFLSWITLATAYRDPTLAEIIYEGYLVGETPVRPVLPVP